MEPWHEFETVKVRVDILNHGDFRKWPRVLVDLVNAFYNPKLEIQISQLELCGHPGPKLEVASDLNTLFVRRGKHHQAFWVVVKDSGREQWPRKSRTGDGHRPTSVLFQRLVRGRMPKSLTVYEDSECEAVLTAQAMAVNVRHSLERVLIDVGFQAAEYRVCRRLAREQQTEFVAASVKKTNLELRLLPEGTVTETELPDSFGTWHVLGVAAIESLIFVHVAVSDYNALVLVKVGNDTLKPVTDMFSSFPKRSGKILGVTNFGLASLVIGMAYGLDEVCLFKFSTQVT